MFRRVYKSGPAHLLQVVELRGMHCDACADRLKRAFEALPGVRAARVTLAPPQAHIDSDVSVPLETLDAAARKAGDYSVTNTSDSTAVSPDARAAEPRPSLFPLLLIVGFLIGVTSLATWFRGDRTWHSAMNDFMAGFFLVFSFFKLLDLRGFADAYQSYDVLARRSRAYALAYPFIELALGVAYLVRFEPVLVNSATLALMLLGSIGVLRALLRKRTIRCACLGTALNLPMTTITLVEDLGMAAMAAFMLTRHFIA